MSNCTHLHFKFECITEFGHGDSTTDITAICKGCGKRGEPVSQWAWPATHDNMRLAQNNLQEDMNKTEVYKVVADSMIDKLQTNGFKIDQKELQEEIPEYIWVLEVENTKGIVYLFGDINNFKDGEDFANQARSFAVDLVNKSR